MLTPATAANAMPQASGARIRLSLTLSDAAKIGLSAPWLAAFDNRERRRRRQEAARTEVQGIVARLLLFAENNDLSLRKLAEKLTIPDRTLRRIRDHQVNPRRWLPLLRAAEARLPKQP